MAKKKQENMEVEHIALKEFSDLLNLPWEKAPHAIVENGCVVLRYKTQDGYKAMGFSLLDFHRVSGYGSLRWRGMFGWLTRYLHRSMAFTERFKPKSLDEVFEIKTDPTETWDNSKTNDLFFELKQARMYMPGTSTKSLGHKFYFTEISEGDSTSSRYEKVWGTTFVQPDPEADVVKQGPARAIGAGDKFIDANGKITYVVK